MKNEKSKVLLVEDEKTLAMIIKDTLEHEGFEVIYATNGTEGLRLCQTCSPDVVIADIMMPEMDGFEMVRRIREGNQGTPILFLTARSSIEDLVHGFNLGGNDYLKKPFKMLELVVRVKALVYRILPAKERNGKKLRIGSCVLDTETQTLTCGESVQELSYMESEILKKLSINPNKVVEINDILNDLWNDNSFYNRNSLHVFICKLRKKLSCDDNVKILNIRGIGYKLILRE